MIYKKSIARVAQMFVLTCIVIGSIYAVWYEYVRHERMARDEACARAHTMCPIVLIPPSLYDIALGYWCSLFPCPLYMKDPLTQTFIRATTTNHVTTDTSVSTTTQPYVPQGDVVYPIEEWTSATGTVISLAGFSFTLPSGWSGSVYEDTITNSLHVKVFPALEPEIAGLIMDCPPAGKGLESATVFPGQERTFTRDGVTYTVALNKWTAQSNNPWYFLFVRNADTTETECLVYGQYGPRVFAAMQELYDTWDMR